MNCDICRKFIEISTMKVIIYFIITTLLIINLCNAQETEKASLFQNYEAQDHHVTAVLIDDRKMKLFSSNKASVKREGFDFSEKIDYHNGFDLKGLNLHLSRIDFTPLKLMLQKRTDFNSIDNIRPFCGPLEDGLYRNFDRQGIILGGFFDYFINDVLLRNLFHWKVEGD